MLPARQGNSQESQTDGDQNSFTVSPTAVNFPKGGGAIRGIGEKLAANPVIGTDSMTVPIATSPGRSGFGPQLPLSYDPGTGNRLFGFSWSLEPPSITHQALKGLPEHPDAEDRMSLSSSAQKAGTDTCG